MLFFEIFLPRRPVTVIMVEEEVVVVEGIFFDMDEKFKIGGFSHFGQNALCGNGTCDLAHSRHILNQLSHEG